MNNPTHPAAHSQDLALPEHERETKALRAFLDCMKQLGFGTDDDINGGDTVDAIGSALRRIRRDLIPSSPALPPVNEEHKAVREALETIINRLHELGFGTDEDINGGDAVEAIGELYAQVVDETLAGTSLQAEYQVEGHDDDWAIAELKLTVRYALNGESAQDMKRQLEYAINHMLSNGMISGDSAATAEEVDVAVHVIDASACEGDPTALTESEMAEFISDRLMEGAWPLEQLPQIMAQHLVNPNLQSRSEILKEMEDLEWSPADTHTSDDANRP